LGTEAKNRPQALSQRVQQDLLFLGRLAELRQRPSFDLANPLLRHSQRSPNLFQGLRLVRVIQAEPANDDLLLALVQPAKDPLDLRFALILLTFFQQRVATMLLGRCEQLVLTRPEPVAMLELARNRPCEILHDRPTRVRAELE